MILCYKSYYIVYSYGLIYDVYVSIILWHLWMVNTNGLMYHNPYGLMAYSMANTKGLLNNG